MNLAEVGANVATGADAVMTHACLTWGPRVVQQADEVGPLGGAVTMCRHGRAPAYQALGMTVRLKAVPEGLSASPEVWCHFHDGGVVVHALAQQEGDEAVEMVAARIRYDAGRSGGGFTVESRCVWHRLGFEPGMSGPEIADMAVSSFRL